MTGSAGDSWSDAASRRDAPGRPIGCAVPHWQPVPHPPRTAMVGRFCRVEPLEPARHGEALFAAYAADVEGGMWTYMPYGPFPEAGAFRSWLEARAGADDPLSYAVVEARSGAALGLASHLRIEPAENNAARHIALNSQVIPGREYR